MRGEEPLHLLAQRRIVPAGSRQEAPPLLGAEPGGRMKELIQPLPALGAHRALSFPSMAS